MFFPRISSLGSISFFLALSSCRNQLFWEDFSPTWPKHISFSPGKKILFASSSPQVAICLNCLQTQSLLSACRSPTRWAFTVLKRLFFKSRLKMRCVAPRSIFAALAASDTRASPLATK